MRGADMLVRWLYWVVIALVLRLVWRSFSRGGLAQPRGGGATCPRAGLSSRFVPVSGSTSAPRPAARPSGVPPIEPIETVEYSRAAQGRHLRSRKTALRKRLHRRDGRKREHKARRERGDEHSGGGLQGVPHPPDDRDLRHGGEKTPGGGPGINRVTDGPPRLPRPARRAGGGARKRY